jgi:hypothetical protein
MKKVILQQKLKYLLGNAYMELFLISVPWLANRHTITNSFCPLFSRSCEDIIHMLFQCKGASEIWEEMGLWSPDIYDGLLDRRCMVKMSNNHVYLGPCGKLP